MEEKEKRKNDVYRQLPHPLIVTPKQYKRVKGFQTGHIVKAVMTKGEKGGTYSGRVAVRKNGFYYQKKGGNRTGNLWLLQRAGGYRYVV